MRIPRAMSAAALGLLLALAGCGVTAAAANTTPPTNSGGPVSIGTDHSGYSSTEHIQATITNTLSTDIYAFDTQASCSVLGLQVQVNGAWQSTMAAMCAQARAATLVKLAAGNVYKATIQAGTLGAKQASFPPGTYRLTLTYYPSATADSSHATTFSSTEFTISGSSSGSSVTPPVGTPANPAKP